MINPWLSHWIVRTLLFAASVFIVSHFVQGIRVRNFGTAIVVALVYGVLNFIAYYIFGLFAWPFAFLTLGLGFWIINAILLLITNNLVPSFQVDGFFTAFVAAFLISIINSVLSWFLRYMVHL